MGGSRKGEKKKTKSVMAHIHTCIHTYKHEWKHAEKNTVQFKQASRGRRRTARPRINPAKKKNLPHFCPLFPPSRSLNHFISIHFLSLIIFKPPISSLITPASLLHRRRPRLLPLPRRLRLRLPSVQPRTSPVLV